MKKSKMTISPLKVILMLVVLLPLYGCSNNGQNKDTYLYFGQSNSWFATYSIIKDKSLYYDSLTIQFLFDDIDSNSKVGPIEYELSGNSMKMKSSYPQELQGTGNFHAGSITNGDVIKMSFDKFIELTVKWQGKTETIKLKRQN